MSVAIEQPAHRQVLVSFRATAPPMASILRPEWSCSKGATPCPDVVAFIRFRFAAGMLSSTGDSVMRILALASVLALLTASQAWAGVPPVPVPEPASLALLALGIGGVALARFRRRK